MFIVKILIILEKEIIVPISSIGNNNTQGFQDPNGDGVIDNRDRTISRNIVKKINEVQVLKDIMRANGNRLHFNDAFGANGEFLLGDINNDGVTNIKDIEAFQRVIGDDQRLTASDFLHRLREEDGAAARNARGAVNDPNFSPIRDAFYDALGQAIRTGFNQVDSLITDDLALDNQLQLILNEEDNISFSASRNFMMNNDLAIGEEYVLYRDQRSAIDINGDPSFAIDITATTAGSGPGNRDGVTFDGMEMNILSNETDANGNPITYNIILDPHQGRITINGQTIDLHNVPAVSPANHPGQNQAAVDQLNRIFEGIFADMNPKPRIRYELGFPHRNIVSGWFQIEFDTPSGETVKAFMHTVPSNWTRGVGVEVVGDGSSEAIGLLTSQPHDAKDQFLTSSDEMSQTPADVLTASEAEREQIALIESSPEYTAALETASNVIENGTDAELNAQLSALDVFAPAGKDIRTQIVTELITRIIDSGNTQSTDINSLATAPLANADLENLANTRPEEFFAAISGIGENVADDRLEELQNQLNQNNLNNNTADNARLTMLINSWQKISDFGDIIHAGIDRRDFSDNPDVQRIIANGFINVLNTQGEIENLLNSGAATNANGQSLSDLRTDLNTNLMALVAVVGNDGDINEMTEVIQGIQNGTSPHSRLINFENSLIERSQAAINNIKNLEAQINNLDRNSASYDEDLANLSSQLARNIALVRFTDDSLTRTRGLSINLAINLDEYDANEANDLTQLFALLQIRENKVNEASTALLAEPFDVDALRTLIADIDQTNMSINENIRGAGGEIQAFQETNSLNSVTSVRNTRRSSSSSAPTSRSSNNNSTSGTSNSSSPRRRDSVRSRIMADRFGNNPRSTQTANSNVNTRAFMNSFTSRIANNETVLNAFRLDGNNPNADLDQVITDVVTAMNIPDFELDERTLLTLKRYAFLVANDAHINTRNGEIRVEEALRRRLSRSGNSRPISTTLNNFFTRHRYASSMFGVSRSELRTLIDNETDANARQNLLAILELFNLSQNIV